MPVGRAKVRGSMVAIVSSSAAKRQMEAIVAILEELQSLVPGEAFDK